MTLMQWRAGADMMQQIKNNDKALRTWLKGQWSRSTILARTAFLCTLFLFVARRILWLYTTPQNYADIPRAISVLDVYLAASWLELPFLAILMFAVLQALWRHRQRTKAFVVAAGD